MADTPAAPRPKHHFITRFFSMRDKYPMTPAQRTYDNLSTFPMFLAAMIWLLSTFFTWSTALSPEYREEGVRLSIVTWLIFALDMAIRFVLDPHKGNFLKRNWPLLVALAFPPLRIILVVMAVMRIAKDRNALTKIVGIYAVYAVLFVVLFGAVFTLIFEIDAPGANITSYGDAVWWGFVTVTTVGYGDFTPVTVGGRAIAVLIMFTGAAAVGAVTAAVASRFIVGSTSGGGSSSSPKASSSPTASPTGAPDSEAQAAAAGSESQSQGPQATQTSHPSPAIVPPVMTETVQEDATTLESLTRQLAALQAQVEGIARKLGVDPAAAPASAPHNGTSGMTHPAGQPATRAGEGE